MLRRAQKSLDSEVSLDFDPASASDREKKSARLGPGVEHAPDPAEVSEAVWTDWRQAIDRAGLAPIRLGRIAPSLKPLPAVIWRKTLGDYSGLKLSEIRRLRTHGEKRVNAILGVFAATYEAVSTAVLNEHLQVDVAPRFVPALTRWLLEVNAADQGPRAKEIEDSLLRPLVQQIDIDLGQPNARIVAERLRMDGTAPTVKQQAERLKVTRARVYQLLDECAGVMEVRWPEGRWLIAPMMSRADRLDPEAAGLLHGIAAVFFPGSLSAEGSGDVGPTP